MHEDLHRREAGGEVGEDRRQHVGAVFVRDADAHQAADGVVAKRPEGLVQVADNALGGQSQALARLGERDPARLAPEQRNGEPLFQALDLDADGRLGPVQRLGPAGHVAVAGDREEGAQQVAVQHRRGIHGIHGSVRNNELEL